MTGPADLAEFRLVRALRAGQPGAFPTLWNAQAGAIWSVLRALCRTDAEAVGWATTFRVELAELASGFGADEPVAGQVGLALYRHLKDGFPRVDALPEPPIPPTEEGARRVPEAARLLYLVTLFFDVPVEALERVAGRGTRATIDAVHRLLEPADDTDARLYVHAALMRAAPVDALILPPGVAPEPPKPKWWPLGLAIAGLVVIAAFPVVRSWLERPDLAELGARHRAAIEDAPLRGSDPASLGLELARRGVPSLLVEVPDLSAAGLTLLGARVLDDPDPAVVLTYQGGTTLWTLQHLLVEPELDGPVVTTLIEGDAPPLVARQAPGAVVVSWEEGATTWVLAADAPPDAVVQRVARIREARATSTVPFIGSAPPVPVESTSE